MSMFLYICTYLGKQLDAGKNYFLSKSHLSVSLFFLQKNLRSHLFFIVADQQIYCRTDGDLWYT